MTENEAAADVALMRDLSDLYWRPAGKAHESSVRLLSDERPENRIRLRLEELRERLGLGRPDLSRASGVHRSNVWRVEQRGSCDTERLKSLIEGMGGKLKFVVCVGNTEYELILEPKVVKT